MEPVAPYAGLGQAPGQRKRLSQWRLRRVECGVEAGHLGEFGRARRDRPDGGEIVRLVQRRERHQPFERVEHRRAHPHRRREFESPVDHAMAGSHQALPAQPLPEPVEQKTHGALVAGLHCATQVALGERGAAGVTRGEARLGQDAFDLAAQRELRRGERAVEEHREFQAR